MSIATQIIAVGNSPATALAINGGNFASGGLTATGTVQGNALLMFPGNNYFTTVAAATGAGIPIMAQGDSIEVYNGGANALLVYTSVTGENVIGLGATAGFSIPVNKGAIFRKVTNTVFAVNLSA
jgi:hypothetical protein